MKPIRFLPLLSALLFLCALGTSAPAAASHGYCIAVNSPDCTPLLGTCEPGYGPQAGGHDGECYCNCVKPPPPPVNPGRCKCSYDTGKDVCLPVT